jgi:hypothetical protein
LHFGKLAFCREQLAAAFQELMIVGICIELMIVGICIYAVYQSKRLSASNNDYASSIL